MTDAAGAARAASAASAAGTAAGRRGLGRRDGATTEGRVVEGCGGGGGGDGATAGKLGLEPGTVYEVVTRQMVETLGEELREIKGRLNGLLFLVAGAVVVDLALRLAGAG